MSAAVLLLVIERQLVNPWDERAIDIGSSLWDDAQLDDEDWRCWPTPSVARAPENAGTSAFLFFLATRPHELVRAFKSVLRSREITESHVARENGTRVVTSRAAQHGEFKVGGLNRQSGAL